MGEYMKIKKFVIALILFGTFLLAILPETLLASSLPSSISFLDLIKRSDLILVVQPTEIVYEPSNKYLNIPAGGWARFQVLEIWKGSLEKRKFTMGWGYYNYFGYNEGVYKNSKHLLFLTRGPRKMFFGTMTHMSFWPLENIKFPGLEGKRQAVVNEYPTDYFTLPLTGQYLLRDVVEVEKYNGEKTYRKAILLNELRLFVKEVLAFQKKKK